MAFLESLRRLFAGSASVDHYDTIKEVESIIGYSFRDKSLLELALTHRSYANNKSANSYSNERLEFLGDSVLGLVIADLLYKDYPEHREGKLTKMKAILVNELTLSIIGMETGLNLCILMSSDEEKLGGRDRSSIVSDMVESILGAVFLDGGLDSVYDIIIRLIYVNKNKLLKDKSQRNYKGELLELIQSRGEGMPSYQLVEESGPDHEKQFSIDVFVLNKKVGSGVGFTKKEAEQKAAAMALTKIKESE